MSKAKEKELDLIEVSPNADPPVVKIMDYAKYVYEQKKKQKTGAKSGKTKRMKMFRFKPYIAEHDINIRVRRAKDYIDKGHNVRLEMMRKGRQPKEQALEKFNEILTLFEGYSTIEPGPKHEGRKIFITIKADGQGKSKKQSEKDSTKEAEEK